MATDEERHSRTREELKSSGYDALLCGSASEVLLLSGYWPVMSASVAVFSADGQVKVILPEDEVSLARETSSAELIPYKPAALDTFKSTMELMEDPLRSAVRSMGLESATIGVQLQDGLQPSTYAASNQFRAALPSLLASLFPKAHFHKCDDLLESMKAVKTQKELALLKTASEVAADGFRAAKNSIEEGVPETVIAAKSHAAFEMSAHAEPLQRSYGYFFCMSGPNSAKADAAFARTRHRTLDHGDLVMVHANTCADGYWTDITRTFTVGEPSPRQQDLRSTLCEARAAGLKTIRPGVTGAEVDHSVREVMEAHGLGPAFKHAAGHGVGFAAANPNGHPRIHPRSPDVLEAGMTFNLEPAAYFDGYGGMRHCDVIAVTQHGAEVITNF